MPHVLVAGRIHEAGLDVLRGAAGFTSQMIDEVSTASYAPLIGEADALLIRTQPLPASVIETAPRLRIVSRHGVGYDAVDIKALDARGIPLTVVGDVNSRSVAEHTLALMLGLAKRIPAYERATRDGDWSLRNSFSTSELWGKCLFIIGFGRIGRLVAGLATAFGMKVLAFDSLQSPDTVLSGGAEPVGTLEEGLRVADFVSLHVPKAGEAALIGAGELRLMRRTAHLVNTARGGLIDEDALAAALEAGNLAGAALDVFAEEPPQRKSRIFASERILMSPHAAGLTEECAIRMGQVAAQNIIDFFAGRLDPALVVNQGRLS